MENMPATIKARDRSEESEEIYKPTHSEQNLAQDIFLIRENILLYQRPVVVF
jgi:hypothetical protein